jgi:hypothetical protein
MPRREDDDVAPHRAAPATRTLIQAGGFLLAAAATLAVFLTDNPQLLKVAVIAVAWAFVLATFTAGRRTADRVAARAREAQLRHAYESELDREVAARREYELALENELRRETEDAMREELDALRHDIATLSGLREEVARVSELRGDIAALTDLRDEVARVGALRDDVAALSSLRDDVAALATMRDELAQLAELRADMGRLRAELTEQLSSEMLVERIVMRTQASRLPGDPTRLEPPTRALDATSWSDEPPRELTGGWPAVRLDESHPETQQFEQVRVERSRPPVPPSEPAASWRSWEPAREPSRWDAPSWETPGTSALSATPPAFTPPAAPSYRPPPVPPSHPTVSESAAWSSSPQPPASTDEPRLWSSTEAPSATSAFPLSPPPTSLTPITPPVEPPPSPVEWLAARSVLDEEPRRRRGDEDAPATDPAAAPTTQRPAVPPSSPPPVRTDDRGGYRVAVRDEPTEEAPRPGQEKRLDQILAENGVSPPTGGRRRRRYRDEDESDDVLARVLGRN